jgi:tRNA-dihydrouridine synthase B
MPEPTPVFFIGSVPIMGDLILAPMDGITDAPYRALIRRMGSAMSTSEFVSTLNFKYRQKAMFQKLKFQPFERPFSAQLLDNDPLRMTEAAWTIYEKFHPDLFDINLGCPDSKVVSRGAGAALLNAPGVIKDMVRLLVTSVPVPVTAKIRLGWAHESQNYLEIAHIIQEEGAAAIAIHGRTRKQGYTGSANWAPIGEVKAALKIPVIGNGDVRSVADIERMKAETGCDAVMIGRAAITNPWLFFRRDRLEVSPAEVHAFMQEQLAGMLAENGPFGLRRFRKFAKAYLMPYNLGSDIMFPLLTCTEPSEFLDKLANIFSSL